MKTLMTVLVEKTKMFLFDTSYIEPVCEILEFNQRDRTIRQQFLDLHQKL